MSKYRIFIVFIVWLYAGTISGFAANSLSFGLVCMLKTTDVFDNCTTGNFSWSKMEQATVLTGYSFGGLFAVLMTGWVADQIGAKWVMFFGSISGFAGQILLPHAAVTTGVPGVFCLQFILGISGATQWAAIAKTVVLWVHPHERATALGVIATSHPLAIFLFCTTGGYVCFNFGWAWLFYCSSFVVLPTAFLTFFFYTNHPSNCKWVSNEELRYITSGIEQTGTETLLPPYQGVKGTVPWMKIMASPVVLAVALCKSVSRMSDMFTTTMLPQYMRAVLGVREDAIGTDIGIPIFLLAIGNLTSGFFSDSLSRKIGRETLTAKMFNTVGFVSYAVTFVGMMFVSTGEHRLMIAYLSLHYLLGGFVTAGYLKSGVAVAPRYSGTVFGFVHSLSYVAGIVFPYMVEGITEGDSVARWMVAFLVMVSLCVVASVSFVVFGSTEIQPWNWHGVPSSPLNSNCGYGSTDLDGGNLDSSSIYMDGLSALFHE